MGRVVTAVAGSSEIGEGTGEARTVFSLDSAGQRDQWLLDHVNLLDGNILIEPRGARGLVRLEVQAPKRDVDLIRALAETLRDESEKAKVLRSTLVKALVHPEIRTAFDVFGSDLPDEVFAGVFEQPRQRQWREINL
jgi:hypothetical protein